MQADAVSAVPLPGAIADTALPATAAPALREAGLHYSSDREPGIRREAAGEGFLYRDAQGRTLDKAAAERIRKFAIPPAWREVWICVDPRGHLQATGLDARGRKQYRYRADWRAVRDIAKFEHMLEFGLALPSLRRRLRRDLALRGLPRDKVLAVVVSLLDSTRARIGNVQYARDNRSYGLTTLRDRHVRFIRDGRARLQFPGKCGVQHDIVIDDRRLARIVRRCQQLPGQQLFQYVDDSGQRAAITSDLVNAYLREAMGADFTAKDFRTWGATLRALALLVRTPLPEPPTERALSQCIVAAVKTVAAELRNTAAVCRKSYINPLVFEAWRDGSLHRVLGARWSAAATRAEPAVIAFLRRQTRRASRRC